MDLVIYKIKNNLLLDFNDLKAVAEHEIKELNLQKYYKTCKNTEIYDKDEANLYIHHVMQINPNTNIIEIDYKKLLMLRKIIHPKIPNNLININWIASVKHEVQHLRQLKDIKQKKNTYTKLLKASMQLTNDKSLYSKLRDKFFIEYDADINSLYSLTKDLYTTYNGLFDYKTKENISLRTADKIHKAYSDDLATSYTSPIIFLNTLMSLYSNNFEVTSEEIEQYIEPTNNIKDDILKARHLNTPHTEYITKICSNEKYTRNIFKGIQRIK